MLACPARWGTVSRPCPRPGPKVSSGAGAETFGRPPGHGRETVPQQVSRVQKMIREEVAKLEGG
jgi:hypothetical protein